MSLKHLLKELLASNLLLSINRCLLAWYSVNHFCYFILVLIPSLEPFPFCAAVIEMF